VNVPAFWNVKENRPPGATVPESHPRSSDVDVCETASVLVHVTVVPTETSARSGLKAVVVSVAAPLGIATDEAAPEGVGAGVGEGAGAGEESFPAQAVVSISSSNPTDKRNSFTTRSTKMNPRPRS